MDIQKDSIYDFETIVNEELIQPEVELTTGRIKGRRFNSKFDGEVRYWREFRGIRFAEPPKRFSKPKAAEKHSGVYDAKGKALKSLM